MISNVASSSYVKPPSQTVNVGEAVERKSAKTNERLLGDRLLGEEKSLSNDQLKSQLIETTAAMNNFIAPMHTSLKFQLHEKLNEYYVSIVDNDSGEVIREIPSKKMLDMYAEMTKDMAFFVDRKI